MAIEQIENIARYDRREGHAPPVLAEAGDTKGFSDEGGEDAEKEAVGQACEAGDEAKGVGVFDAKTAYLGGEEDERGDEKAPEAGHAQLSHDEVGSDALGLRLVAMLRCRKDVHIPLTNRPQKLMMERISTCISCRSWMNSGDALSS